MTYLTLAEVADHLRVSRATIYRLMADGELKSIKVRGHRRVPATSLAAYEKRQLRKAS